VVGIVSVTAPPLDTGGAALDAMIVVAQNLANSNANLRTLYQAQQYLNQLQVEAVDHYMVTGWLNAATILATYSAPPWDVVGQRLKARVAFLQNLVNNAPANNPTNPVTANPLSNYQQQLYQAQIQLVERIMDVPGGTSAATMLANLTGFQSFTFEYVYTSIGSTSTGEDF
jgi:dienelactone hydrolase